MIRKILAFFLENRLISIILLLLSISAGLVFAPFQWNVPFLPAKPTAVDAIPDIGENQQIIYTEWEGRSPQDIDDQITYPLTTTLLGIPGVKSVRSSSMFGFSSIYLIFEDDVAFYWSRARILEKLNALPAGTLPDEVQPTLGPDATALGQIFWYTLEPRDENDQPTRGWDLHEIRSVQDYYVRYALASTQGVSEVASIGGHVRQYQIDLIPEAMNAHGIGLQDVVNAVKGSNLDVGAQTIEMNRVEYFVRGIGYLENVEDLQNTAVKTNEQTPIFLKDIAQINIGPAPRRGVLDKDGQEVVGGVVVARYGENPMAVIQRVKDKIKEIQPGLKSKTLEDGTVSQIKIIPFYDRTELIQETLGTLSEAIELQVLITIIVIIVLLMNLRASFLISLILPISVLMTFIVMYFAGVDANIVSLSGIAIAIGTIVDVGIVMVEQMVKKMEEDEGMSLLKTISEAANEVASAILTAITTTIISFIPVFTLTAAEGKLFTPLAFSKTFVLIAAIVIAFAFLPTLTYYTYKSKGSGKWNLKEQKLPIIGFILLVLAAFLWWQGFGIAYVVAFFGGLDLAAHYQKTWFTAERLRYLKIGAALIYVATLLTEAWMPLGAMPGFWGNLLFVAIVLLAILAAILSFISYYPFLLNKTLDYPKAFLSLPFVILLLGLFIWQGFDKVFHYPAKMGNAIGLKPQKTATYQWLSDVFPGLQKEFMPSLDEGSFLLMPTSMVHAGVEENVEVLKQLDKRVASIPEVREVVGKLGKVNSALDPAPISMYENVINYKSEYLSDENGYPIRFKVDKDNNFVTDEDGELIPDSKGQYFRQWRDHIKSPDDIWNEIVKVTKIPGVTSAPKLQPIETRIVMLQTGMRAPMGVKVMGPDLETIDAFSLKVEKALKEVEGVKKEAVFADRMVGKPYLEVDWDRNALAQYGLKIQDVQAYLQSAVGGMPLTTTVEGRERYEVRVRYARLLRENPEAMKRILIPTASGAQLPLGTFAEINYRRGPQMVRSENTFLTAYVIFDRASDVAEITAVNNAREHLEDLIQKGKLKVPDGVTYEFAGNYQNQLRAEQTLSWVVPLVMVIIFLILYLQFRQTSIVLMVFSAIMVAFSGGFILLWLYGQEWFMDFSLGDQSFRQLFQIQTYHLSVAVWVGFIALFGIATDDGVLMATYIRQQVQKLKPEDSTTIREAVVKAAAQRIRPCMMTTATTILALLPIMTSTGKGSDIMVPMAIPALGGMLMAIITVFVVPILYSLKLEKDLNRQTAVNDSDHSSKNN